jgi:hypothetical protein
MPKILDSLLYLLAEHHHRNKIWKLPEPCYETAVDVLCASTIDISDKLIWAIDQVLAESYDFSQPLSDFIYDDHPAEAWSKTADQLLIRLQQSTPSSLADIERREKLSNLAKYALEKSHRDDEIINLCRK